MNIAGAVFIFAVLSSASGIDVSIPKKLYEVARGDNVTLPCKFVPKSQNNPSITVTWTALGNDPNDPTTESAAAFFYPGNSVDAEPGYGMNPDITQGQVDLFISGVTLAQNKTFECHVIIAKDGQGKPIDTTRLLVLVAPSKPVCTVKGTLAYGQDISLTCVSEEGSPPPTYNWESYDVNNVKRPLPARATSNNGVLSLFNISKDTSGYYICTSANKIRSATCNYTLSVMPPSMNIGSTAGFIGGAVAAVLVLIIIIYCCCCRKKKEAEDYEMEDHEKEYLDNEPNETKSEYHDDKYADHKERSNDRTEVHAVQNERPNEHRDNADRHDDYDDRRNRYDDPRDNYSDRNERYDDRRDRHDDRRDNYSDRGNTYDDRRDRYDDRRDNYDRRDRYDDRRDNYDRRDRYDDRRDDDDRSERFSDRRDNYDRRDRYDDRRDDDRSERYGDRRNQFDEAYDDRRDRYDDRDRPPIVPPGKPKKMDNDN